MRRPPPKGCNNAFAFGLGLLVGSILPCGAVVIISAMIICILSLFANKH
ncbi:MAG: hypothetical protein UH241_01125 [Acutalibacteraceae bacterium]|nr:hypothetical protein [Acutalibacteraceae bacterium]